MQSEVVPRMQLKCTVAHWIGFVLPSWPWAFRNQHAKANWIFADRIADRNRDHFGDRRDRNSQLAARQNVSQRVLRRLGGANDYIGGECLLQRVSEHRICGSDPGLGTHRTLHTS